MQTKAKKKIRQTTKSKEQKSINIIKEISEKEEKNNNTFNQSKKKDKMDRENDPDHRKRTVSTNVDYVESSRNRHATINDQKHDEINSSGNSGYTSDDDNNLNHHKKSTSSSRKHSGNSLSNNKSNSNNNSSSSGDSKQASRSEHVYTVETAALPNGKKKVFKYTNKSRVGNGSFGTVYRVVEYDTKNVLAIKKVLQDERYKNRELQIMRMLKHASICDLKYFYYSKRSDSVETFTYLHLVLEFVNENMNQITKRYKQEGKKMPIPTVKLYAYQIFRSLGYIHSLGICHRDIKPQNLLVNSHTGVVKLCDFGSAKILVPDQVNVSYICSRYYRAPELIFGSTFYTTAIDVWSAGCVLSELMTCDPIFPGENGIQQLIKIIKILGTPSQDEILEMNPEYTEFHYNNVAGTGLAKVIPEGVEESELILPVLQSSLLYKPKQRLSAIQLLTLPFFNEVKHLYNHASSPISEIFNFSNEELSGLNETEKKLLLA